MSTIGTANFQHPSRAALAWAPAGYDGRTHFGPLIAAMGAAVGILAVATTLLLAIL